MHVWVLSGWRGMLGRELADTLIQNGYSVQRTNSTNGFDEKFTVAQVRKIIEDGQITHIVNCSAYTDVDGDYKSQSAKYLNEGLPRVLAQVLRTLPHVRLIHISTDYLFNSENPMKKFNASSSNKPNPCNEYGKSKLKSEE